MLKVLDFGLAKLREATGALSEAENSRARSGLSIADRGWRDRRHDPRICRREQAEGKTVDARSDIFSFGSVLYEMLTGRRHFAAIRKFRRWRRFCARSRSQSKA